jgi:two-component system CheB/CheR fusion protein
MEKKPRKPQAIHTDDAINNKVAGGCPPVIIVGIGAGSGALKPLKTILGGLPFGRGLAVILIHHPELTKKNLLNLLKGQTALEVVEAADGMAVLADRIYVMPPDKFLNIAQDRLTLKEPVHCDGLLMPIDHFFCSLAADRRKRCCGILLSGGGSDGTLGLSEIKAAGGGTIVEGPKNAKFPDMPRHAIGAGVADAVLPVDAIAKTISDLAEQAITAIQSQAGASPEMDADLKAILDILRAKVGHDFRCYKPGTLLRRIRRRMTLGKIATMEDYVRFLSDQPDEVGLLQKDLLIGVTDFFRQPQAWETLENRVIAQLLTEAAPGSEIRVWVPGCASGKEVYSLAILLTEAMEKSDGKTNFQIFATDADFAALAKARTGSYPAEEVRGNMTAERLKRFFSRRDGHYQVVKSIRERIVFAAQNITADPPFSRLDLIVCRNLLIYLDQQAQWKIIALFHFALRDGGFLFLGNAETIGDREDLFEPVSKKWRIYRRIGVGHRVNVEIPASSAQPTLVKPPASAAPPRLSLTSLAQQTLLDRFAPACAIIDRKHQVLYVHGMIENYLTIPAGELTTRVVDMAREGLRARLRGAIGKCVETGRPVAFTARTRRGEKSVPVKATVSRLRHLRETDGLLLITFEDQRSPAAKSGGQGTVNGDVRQLADELKITREELQSTIGQLEGSNDQLKASNEEVMAANEELQSANEEMETSKEELQSLNEELNTINVRLQEKVDELESANNDVVNLLASTSIATLFLDKQFRIKRYTPAITRLMSLIPTDQGRPIGDILMRFTDAALLDDARQVLVDLTPAASELRADDGRWYIRRIMPYRTQDDRIEGVVITFVDVADLKQAQEALDESRRGLAVIMDSIADGFFAIDREWRFIHVNDAAVRHFGKTRDQMLGRNLLEVFPAARGTAFETGYRQALESGEPVHFEAPSTVADRMMEIHAYPGRENLTVLFRDITERRRLEEELRTAHDRAVWLARFPDENPNPVIRTSAEGTILYCNPASVKNLQWACSVGHPLPDPVRTLVTPAMTSGEELYREIQLGEKFFAVTVTPFPAESYVNVYGREITKRKQAEESLRRSEERLKRAQEIAHLGSWELDMIDNRLAWSDEAYRIFGLEPQEFHATYEAFLERVHSDDRDAVDAAYSGSIRENRDTYEIEHRVLRKDTGELRFVHERCQHFRDTSGKIIRSVGMVHDITERKQAEESLRKLNAELEERVAAQTAEIRQTCEAVEAERQRFYSVLELLPAYVVLLTPDYHVPFANRFFRERFGESQGKRCYEYLFQRTEPCDICETYTVLKTGKPHHWEWTGPDNRDYDVHDFPFTDNDGAPFILEMGIDVTEIKRAEAALKAANETLERRVAERTAELEAARMATEGEKRLLETVMEALPVGVAITNITGGNIKSNRAFEEVWGGPRPATDSVADYAAYKAWWTDAGKPVRPEEWASAKAVQTGQTVRNQLMKIERFDGSQAFILNSASPILDAEGKIIGSAVAIRDITEIKQAEEALKERTRQLEAANSELEGFSYTISHDLRAPLRAIDGYSRMILRKHADKLDEDTIGKFNVIRENTRMMGQLIDDLLDFSRLGRAQLSTVTLDMKGLIGETWEELKAASPDRHMTLKTAEIPPCRGDRTLIKQVLVNILSNAVKFTEGRKEALIEVGGAKKDGEIVYSIRDNGAGFDMRYYDKLFGVFQRLHGADEFEGTGVGLAIVQRIIHRHGGRAWAEGEIDKGACFWFSLPA